MTGLADPHRTGLLETSDPNDPRPLHFPDQGPWQHFSAWSLFTVLVGTPAAYGGMAALLSPPAPRVALAVVLFCIWPVGVFFSVRACIAAWHSTDVYAACEDGVRTGRELREWEERETARRAVPRPTA